MQIHKKERLSVWRKTKKTKFKHLSKVKRTKIKNDWLVPKTQYYRVAVVSNTRVNHTGAQLNQ